MTHININDDTATDLWRLRLEMFDRPQDATHDDVIQELIRARREGRNRNGVKP